MERNRRTDNSKTNNRRKDNRRRRNALWRRCMAALAAAVTVLTGLNYSGLNNVLAEGKSGYQIDVSYTEDGTGAVLTGNMENLLAGTELATLREEDGTEYDPEHFQMTVTENGTYTYTLEYGENIPETGKAVQREETLEVTVDQIRTEKEKNMSEPDLASDNSTAAPQQSSEQTGGGSQNGESAALSEDAPETVPLAVLEAELETLADGANADSGESIEQPSHDVYQYAYEEKGLSLATDPVSYFGGLFSENAPEYKEGDITRTYVEAALLISISGADEEAGVPVTGIYPHDLDGSGDSMAWYYTTGENTAGTSADYGNIQVGYKIPDGAQVRLYYKVPENPKRSITFKTNSTGIAGSEFGLTVKNSKLNSTGNSVTAVPTERVSIEFTLPSSLENMTVSVTAKSGACWQTLIQKM